MVLTWPNLGFFKQNLSTYLLFQNPTFFVYSVFTHSNVIPYKKNGYHLYYNIYHDFFFSKLFYFFLNEDNPNPLCGSNTFFIKHIWCNFTYLPVVCVPKIGFFLRILKRYIWQTHSTKNNLNMSAAREAADRLFVSFMLVYSLGIETGVSNVWPKQGWVCRCQRT